MKRDSNKTKVVSFRMTDEELAKLDWLAAKHGRTRNEEHRARLRLDEVDLPGRILDGQMSIEDL